MRSRSPSSQAFTLFEVTIVLVIIALIAGGTLAGRDLIRAAQLRSVTNDFQLYRSSVNSFAAKYNQLPGDMKNATDIWGRVGGGSGQCANPDTDSDLGSATCNGNGDGHIDGLSNNNEKYRVWEHLVAAGFIGGVAYTGINDGGNGVTFGVNAPKSRIRNAGFTIYYLADGSSNANEWPNFYGNLITFGAVNAGGGTTANYAIRPAITPAEAYAIDSKIDDGKPGYGYVYTQRKTSTYAPDCVNTDDQATAIYDTTKSDILCMLGMAIDS